MLHTKIKSCESQTAEQRWLAASCLEIPLVSLVQDKYQLAAWLRWLAASCLEIPLVSLVQDKYLLAAWLRWLAASWAVMSSVLGQGDKWRFT